MVSARFLLDTNIVVFALRGPTEVLRSNLRDHADHLAVSAVTVSELHYGIERSAARVDNRRAVTEFLSLVTVLPFDVEAAEHAGEIRAALADLGQPIGGYDVLIAGHARSRGLAVVTNNRRAFDRVPGLLVTDWTLGT